MRLLLLLSLFSVPVIAADEFLEFGDKNFAAEKTGESKWTLRSGFQYIDYPMSLPAFKGEHDETTAKDTTGIYGLNIAVGREFYLGAGISSTFLLSGNYYKSINKEVGIAAQDVDVDVSNTRIDSQLQTYEASISLNYLFDNPTFDIQPFAEFGMGAGRANIEKDYARKALPNETNGSEKYYVRSQEDFLYSKASLGVNIIAFNGLISYFKITGYAIAKQEIELEGESKLHESAVTESLDNTIKSDDIDEIDQVYSATVGMGYLF